MFEQIVTMVLTTAIVVLWFEIKSLKEDRERHED